MPVDQKRIAKNTALLYIRMVLVLAVSLYSSRVIVYALGDTDFGLYTSVGSIVTMFSFISITMSNACQRFYAYALGREDYAELQRVFSLTLVAFATIGVIVALLAEGTGFWLMDNRLNLAGRDTACHTVLHMSVLATLFTVLRIPYQGMVIARERMNLFAYLSVFEALATLGIAFALKNINPDNFDRLRLYSTLLMAVQLILTLLYYLYCRICYKECRFTLLTDRERLKEIFRFSGWELAGAFAGSMKSYGVNTLVNFFFLPGVVAARGIAQKVCNSILQLQTNFYTAVKPQITKSYAAGELEDMRKLVAQSTRFTFYLLYLIALPIMLETPFLLDLWLVDVNPLAPLFTRLYLLNILIDVFSTPFNACIQSTGKNRGFQIAISITLLLIIPVVWAGYKWLEWPPHAVFLVSIVMSSICQVVRFQFVKRQIGFTSKGFLKDVVWVICMVMLLSAAIPVALKLLLAPSVLNSFIVMAAAAVCCAVVCYTVGITATERGNINGMVTKFLKFRKL